MARPAELSLEDAEVLALRALAFLASEPDRLGRFLSLTGLTPNDLQDRADTAGVQAAVIGHLLQNESELLVFASEQQISPDGLAPAHHLLLDES